MLTGGLRIVVSEIVDQLFDANRVFWRKLILTQKASDVRVRRRIDVDRERRQRILRHALERIVFDPVVAFRIEPGPPIEVRAYWYRNAYRYVASDANTCSGLISFTYSYERLRVWRRRRRWSRRRRVLLRLQKATQSTFELALLPLLPLLPLHAVPRSLYGPASLSCDLILQFLSGQCVFLRRGCALVPHFRRRTALELIYCRRGLTRLLRIFNSCRRRHARRRRRRLQNICRDADRQSRW